MGESAWGSVLRGIRDDEIAPRALGCNVVAFKVVVFGLTSAFAGLAGVLLFYYNQIASPSVYGLNVSLKIFAMTIFGGLGNFTGSILGAAVLQLMQPMLEKLVRLDPGQAFLIQLVIYGLGLVVLVRVRPQGLLPEGLSLWRGSDARLGNRNAASRDPLSRAIAVPATAGAGRALRGAGDCRAVTRDSQGAGPLQRASAASPPCATSISIFSAARS